MATEKILIVDDESNICELLRMYLEKGGYDTVIAMLNYGLSGHVNVSCDMEVTRKEGIHYGFLSPYTQQLGWRNWQQPWFLRDELEDMIRDYAKLRSSLIPYRSFRKSAP